MATYLLDKNVVRRAIEGIVKTQFGRTLAKEEVAALRLLFAAEHGRADLYISVEMQNILSRYLYSPDVQLFLGYVHVLVPARYFRRWACRLREHGFTREDAKILALATFGAEPLHHQLGVKRVVTYDLALIHHVGHLQERLVRRLKAMSVQLPAPYAMAKFPVVQTPHGYVVNQE